ncbi:hypothetical protein SAMN05444336_102316 [Albimonas donghaensis]|uniref:Uncharacterized protein n=1 Tax=Albimonas donghaensis TaxID=356660 RepID=A0A1H2WAB6_9RHOB|nr:hypothetical protein [Albimonas donghaensis]MAS42364.1 hypothetical protein [Paracoccaceae bacterium]MBR27199.1 hypothetical protein [Paracoccaceae bacterium]SDW77572.1 hypothetical protein SAMN05444336_102316 [Albimonas donghaensis]
MTLWIRINIGASAVALAILAAAAATPALAAQETFVTSAGKRVTLTPARQMGCGAMARKIEEIDSTGYRGRNPQPIDPADQRLFKYETAVSNRYYSRCRIVGPVGTATEVLRSGFRKSGPGE